VHSVSINPPYRITLQLLITEQEIVPLNVGDHDADYCVPPRPGCAQPAPRGYKR
jgi:hypothetical protein